MRFLVTGGAGFIGSSLIDDLLTAGHSVVCMDNFDSYYDETIKRKNIHNHYNYANYQLIERDIRSDLSRLPECDTIIHLAARAGVRPSILQPMLYQSVNIEGTQNLLEFAKVREIKKFIFASSSSVYGVNPNTPWREDDYVLNPISPYAATKIAGELIGHSYAYLYPIQFIGLRFFTVYGPRQRPDLAIHKFTRAIIEESPIEFYGDGSTSRDYTYISDIVSGIKGAINYDKEKFAIFNLGNCRTTTLKQLVEKLEIIIGKSAIFNHQPLQPGDVPVTFADVTKSQRELGYNPETPIDIGLEKFVKWYLEERCV
ncbi:MAG: GDP-mannose 4,6-dehydratase [Negativicutes bacterium]|jgi:UDP-glucuronate 4-epimerase